MSIFDDVSITWGEETYSCPANKVFSMLAHMESKGVSLMSIISSDGTNLTAQCSAFSYALEFMGASVSPEEVYSGLFLNGRDGMMSFLYALQKMIIPPDVVKRAESMSDEQIEKATSKKKPQPKSNEKTTTAATS